MSRGKAVTARRGKCEVCEHRGHDGFCGRSLGRKNRCACYHETPLVAGVLGEPQFLLPGVEPPPQSMLELGGER